jgi:hypothetical protein
MEEWKHFKIQTISRKLLKKITNYTLHKLAEASLIRLKYKLSSILRDIFRKKFKIKGLSVYCDISKCKRLKNKLSLKTGKRNSNFGMSGQERHLLKFT